MKRIVCCMFLSLMILVFSGCNGIHITFDSNDKGKQEETQKDQTNEGKSQQSDDKATKQNAENKPSVSVNINEAPKIQEKPEIVIVREQTPVYVTNGNFIFPDSSNSYITKSQILTLSDSQLGIARNEIYARHGYIFSTEKYNQYFKAQSWYKPITKNVSLNNIETYNVNLIQAEENKRGIK